jgi:hypothetical protein
VRSTILRFLVLGSILIGLVAACTPTDPIPTEGTVSVRVIDAVTSDVLDDVTIQVRPSGGTFTTPQATVQADGSYTFVLPVGTGYTITLAQTGYLTATYNNVAVVGGQTTFLAQLLLIDEPSMPKRRQRHHHRRVRRLGAAGRHGTPAGASQHLLGHSHRDDDHRRKRRVRLRGPRRRLLHRRGHGAGYIPSFFTLIVVGGQANGGQNFSIAPVGSGDLTRIVLTWGLNPSDLDSHLTGPAIGGDRFHVYFVNRTYSEGGVTYAELDVDDVSSFGPETISIYEQIAGTYRYSVHDYTNLDSSPAARRWPTPAHRCACSAAPTWWRPSTSPQARARLWTVFELSGTGIVPINTMSYESDELR